MHQYRVVLSREELTCASFVQLSKSAEHPYVLRASLVDYAPTDYLKGGLALLVEGDDGSGFQPLVIEHVTTKRGARCVLAGMTVNDIPPELPEMPR